MSIEDLYRNARIPKKFWGWKISDHRQNLINWLLEGDRKGLILLAKEENSIVDMEHLCYVVAIETIVSDKCNTVVTDVISLLEDVQNNKDCYMGHSLICCYDFFTFNDMPFTPKEQLLIENCVIDHFKYNRRIILGAHQSEFRWSARLRAFLRKFTTVYDVGGDKIDVKWP